MIDVYEVKVFCDKYGNYGDKHGIIIDESRSIDNRQRLKLAAQLGYAETVYINDIKQAAISFFAQTEEIPFAGTAALAAAGMLRMLTGTEPTEIISQGHHIPINTEDDLVWVTADLSIMPPWHIKKLRTAQEIDHISATEAEQFEHTLVWAWFDESKGIIRGRTFATDWLIPEAEANGSGSMLLATKLKRPITVNHGIGSTIYAEPLDDSHAKLGGHVVTKKTPASRIDKI